MLPAFGTSMLQESCVWRNWRSAYSETHLIPNVFKAICSNENLKVFGSDYSTPDGTCIRDYVHVTDLARAHLLSIEHMKQNAGFSVFNLGNGDGFSVLEIIKGCERISMSKISYTFEKT